MAVPQGTRVCTAGGEQKTGYSDYIDPHESSKTAVKWEALRKKTQTLKMIHAHLMPEPPRAQRVTPKYLLLFEEIRAQRRKADYRSETRIVRNVLGKSFSRRLQGSQTAKSVLEELRSLLGGAPTDKRGNTFQLEQLRSTQQTILAHLWTSL